MTRAKINIYKSKEDKTPFANVYTNSSGYPKNLMPMFEEVFEEVFLNLALSKIIGYIDCVPVFNVTYIYDVYLEDKIAIAFNAKLNWDKGTCRKGKEVVRTTPERKFSETNERG